MAIFRGLRASLFCIVLGGMLEVSAEIRVIDESAIPYTGFLSKADFDQRFPGELLPDPSALSSGWYVIYEHQSLNYYFGPVLLQSTGEDYLAELKDIVEQAVAQRPDIRDYRLELSFEPTSSSSSSNSNSASNPSSSPSGGTPQTSSSWSIFDFIKKVFGLR
ncbi:hypothetical protein [Coraliomargarita parva]|uniref:hypothetical protein n=1 Tax=Coraliomargarita parva TaxID=3014050 RepID=UPI0022B31238|nr:hypothetical protein [Coraliomargarita parva]